MQDYLDEIGNHPHGQAVILWHMAGLYAMNDQAGGQATLTRAKSHLDLLGPKMTATGTEAPPSSRCPLVILHR